MLIHSKCKTSEQRFWWEHLKTFLTCRSCHLFMNLSPLPPSLFLSVSALKFSTSSYINGVCVCVWARERVCLEVGQRAPGWRKWGRPMWRSFILGRRPYWASFIKGPSVGCWLRARVVEWHRGAVHPEKLRLACLSLYLYIKFSWTLLKFTASNKQWFNNFWWNLLCRRKDAQSGIHTGTHNTHTSILQQNV